MSNTIYTPPLATSPGSPATVQAISGVAQTTLTGPDELGSAPLDPSVYLKVSACSIILSAVLNVSTPGQTATLELFNKTDGTTVISLTTTSLTPIEVRSAPLSVPSQLPNARKLYGFRLSRTGGASTDFVVCKYAALEITYQ